MSDEDLRAIVSFRLTNEEYKEAERVAQMASRLGKLRNDSVIRQRRRVFLSPSALAEAITAR